MNLNVSLVQPYLVWENTNVNLTRIEKLINGIQVSTDLIVLPEMFPTGFSMNTQSVAENMRGPSMQWLMNTASERSCCITGSIMIKDGDNYYNRLIFMFPSGDFKIYDKRHLFRMGEEDKYFKPGKQSIIIELNKWRIKPLICYDLRFPVWSRNRNDYDLLIYVASWPEPRIEVWDALLKARAIENQSYVIGVSRIGKDANNLNHTGDSTIFDFKGRQILKLPSNTETTATITLDKKTLDEFRKVFPVWRDSDEFKLID